MVTKKVSNINDELDIKLFVFIAKRSLLYVFAFIFVALAVAFIYLRYTHPVYQAQATIQINTDKKAEKILETENIYEDDLAKKIELLKSPVFLDRALSKLPLEISYFTEGRILAYEQYRNSPYEVEAFVKHPAIYGVPIYISFNGNGRYELSYTSADGNKFDAT